MSELGTWKWCKKCRLYFQQVMVDEPCPYHPLGQDNAKSVKPSRKQTNKEADRD